MPHNEVSGSARVAYRYRNKYYFGADWPEDFSGKTYTETLQRVLSNVPSDPIAFQAWKDERVDRLLALENELHNAHDEADNDEHDHDNDLESASLSHRKQRRQSFSKFLYPPGVHKKPYPLGRIVQQWYKDWNSNLGLSWFTLELDFDNMCLLLHGYPILKLQPDMPSSSLVYQLHAARRTNSYGHPFSLGQSIPNKYRYDIERDIPICHVEDASLLSYTQHAPTVVSKIHKLLCLPSTLSVSEKASVAYRENLLGIYLHRYGPDLLRHIVLAGTRTLSPHEKSLALRLLTTMLCPTHSFPPFDSPMRYPVDPRNIATRNPSSWWPRKHICVTLASHLQAVRNCRVAIGQLIDEILRNKSSPAVTYGIAFSVVHCVIVRVSKSATGPVLVVCTPTLQFLPDFCGHHATTSGTRAVARLGYMPALDDIQFFESSLRKIPYAVRKRGRLLRPAARAELIRIMDQQSNVTDTYCFAPPHDSNERLKAATLFSLPTELILEIARYLFHPCDLNALAVTCKALMDACLPLVRLPQVLDVNSMRVRDARVKESKLPPPYWVRFYDPARQDQYHPDEDEDPVGFILTRARHLCVKAKNGDVNRDVYMRMYWAAALPQTGCTEVTVAIRPFGTPELRVHQDADCLKRAVHEMEAYEATGTMTMLDLEEGWELETIHVTGDQRKTAAASFQAWCRLRR